MIILVHSYLTKYAHSFFLTILTLTKAIFVSFKSIILHFIINVLSCYVKTINLTTIKIYGTK